MDGTVPFNINQIVQGDILIRCRHLTFGRKRVSMFRAAFHTGYAPPNVLRLTKTQLDGACHDKRYPDDFFLDLIFEKVDADALARLDKEEETESEDDAVNTKGRKGKGPIVKASQVDSMLEGDSRFWDVISSKKQEHVKQVNDDPFWGPTVGRRRGHSTKKGANSKDENPAAAAPTQERTHLETFSIGSEFDFLPVSDTAKTQKKPPERDSLMDALNALDEEEGPSVDTTEEIVFDTVGSSASTASKPTKPIFNDYVGTVIADVDKEQVEKENCEGESATTTEPIENSTPVEDLLKSDDDMDALLASADEDFGDLDLADFDDDNDLEDLENLLKA